MIFSNHALERMAKRGLSKPLAIGVLIAGKREPCENGRTRFIYDDYVVVTNKSEDVVITMFQETKSTDKRRNRTIYKHSRKQIRKLRITQ